MIIMMQLFDVYLVTVVFIHLMKIWQKNILNTSLNFFGLVRKIFQNISFRTSFNIKGK